MIGFPFDSHVTYDAEGNPIYDRAISSAPYRKLLRELFKTGIMPTDSSNMQVAAGEGMSVIVNPGFAMVEGCMKLEEEVTNLSIQASDSALDRIDTVVLRLDSNENVRSCEFAIVSGVPSLVPIRPELTRNESVYEIGLADVLVSKTITVISDSKITDTRFDNERCGVVSSISEFDTTTLNQQMVAWSREQREEFSAWVDSIKDILDESTAGHLQNEIDELRESAGGAKEMIADEYSATKTYNAGELCIDNNTLWKSKIDNNRGNAPVEGTYWTATTIANGVSELNQNLTDLENNLPKFAVLTGNWGSLSDNSLKSIDLPYPQGFDKDNCFIESIMVKDASGLYRSGVTLAFTTTVRRIFGVLGASAITISSSDGQMANKDFKVLLIKAE